MKVEEGGEIKSLIKEFVSSRSAELKRKTKDVEEEGGGGGKQILLAAQVRAYTTINQPHTGLRQIEVGCNSSMGAHWINVTLD